MSESLGRKRERSARKSSMLPSLEGHVMIGRGLSSLAVIDFEGLGSFASGGRRVEQRFESLIDKAIARTST